VLPSEPVDPALQVHADKTELANGDSECVGHVKHVTTFVAPTTAEYVPIPHSVHVSDPASALYFPATHSEQAPPLGPEEPALHVQLFSVPEPIGEDENVGHATHVVFEVAASECEYVFAAHDMQFDEPRTDLNVPATHATQVCASREYPLSHRQEVMVLLPALEFELLGQRLQSATESEPSAARYVFVGQSVQLWSPIVCLYFPG
jgi:hypothetical protein